MGFFGLFGRGKDLTPEELKKQLRGWNSDIRRQIRQSDREVRDINREKKKVADGVKQCAKRGDMASARTLAKEIVRSNATITRLYTQKANLISMQVGLNEQMATVKVAGALEQSTTVMTSVTNLMKVPELMGTMQEMSREMMKAGLIGEMMDEAVDEALDTEDLEEETEAEVDAILTEITGETLASLPEAGKQQVATGARVEAEPEGLDDALEARLQAMTA